MKHRRHLDALRGLVRSATSDEDGLARVVAYLHDNLDRYDWVGVYLVDPATPDGLVLGPWKGERATEHARIPFGLGICGSCAETRRTEVVPDVDADARYLACFGDTRSEVVVPMMRDGEFWGEIDVDSSTLDAFGPDDVELLEAVAGLLSGRA